MPWITIPNIFGGRSNAPVTEIDADFAAITTALNTFNPSGSPLAPSGGSFVRGLIGANAGIPNTQYNVQAEFVSMRNPSNGSLMISTPVGVLTNDVLLAGPVVNGRDQAGAFTANSWLHYYFIGNPTTTNVATISSVTAPPTGPTLPTGYTVWAYAGAVRFDGSSHLLSTLMRGALMSYSQGVAVVSTGATPINTETTVGVGNEVPPNALSYLLTASIILTNGGTSGYVLDLRVISGLTAATLRGGVDAPVSASAQAQVTLPTVGITPQYFYLWNVDTPSGAALVETQASVNGYRVANGDA